MLKFIRKFQLPILVIGGSLLMIVFLLEPVITRMSPSPDKAKIATINDSTQITAGDRQMAEFELNVVGRINPRSMEPLQRGGLGLDPDDSKRPLHWLMMIEEATNAGLVGDAADGRAWIDEIAQSEAFIMAQQQFNQGLMTQSEAEQHMLELTSLFAAQLHRNALSAAGAIPGYTQDDVYRTLAKARGVYRLRDLYEKVPAFSDLGAINAAHESSDAIAVNASLINASILTDSIADPSEEELQAFFDEYKDQFPAQSEFGIGYQQPTRVRLAYLMLDRNVFMNAVKIDRVELVKIKKQNPDTYPGDFASERAKIERKFREDKSTEMMIEADRIIRAQVLNSTRGLPKDKNRFQLPEDWDTRRPKLEDIAQTIVTTIKDQYDVNIPTPTVEVFGSTWLDAGAIRALPDFGSAQYRFGSQRFPTFAIPSILSQPASSTSGFVIQPGLPLADPPATNEIGSRFYATVLEFDDAGPADSIDDAGRDRVIRDYKGVKGYEQLVAHADQIRAAIAATGSLDAGINAALALATTQPPKPAIYKNILVRKDTIDRGRLNPFVDPTLNTPDFRDAVRQAAKDIDPLTPPSDIDPAAHPIAVPVPAARSLAIATLVAPRPITAEDFRIHANQILRNQTTADLIAANEALLFPFSYEALAQRLNLVILQDKDKDTSSSDPKPETDA